MAMASPKRLLYIPGNSPRPAIALDQGPFLAHTNAAGWPFDVHGWFLRIVKSPVLFLVFNRPATTRRVFEAIRAACPRKLYVAADGARPDRPSEARSCEEVRAIATAVDWPCEVRTLFRERNLGCKLAVSGAITWFFEQEPEGIILEDDVLPLPTFFAFCDELLDRYRHDERVAMISGSNLVANHFHARESYFFSYHCNVWGWATWRRAWRHYDVTVSDWPAWRDGGGLQKIGGGQFYFETYWRRVFDAVHSGRINAWGYQWTFACWRRGALTVLPARNQIDNLGYGADATHTTADAPAFVREARTQALDFPLAHPNVVAREPQADAEICARVYGISYRGAIGSCLRTVPLIRNLVVLARQLLKSVHGH
jgi:hypothetical protein